MLIRNWLRYKKREINVRKNLLQDVFHNSKYHADAKWANNNGMQAARDILVYSHVVEKGLSHKKLKPNFGLDRISKLSNALAEYIQKGGKDQYVIDVGVAAIEKYNEVNQNLGVSKDQEIPLPANCQTVNKIDIGTYEVNKENFFSASSSSFGDLCKARHSVRLYDCKSEPIKYDTIAECVALAQNCPSACNRQGVNVKIVLDAENIKKISDIQRGCSGFGENSGAFVIITADLSLYKSTERKLPMIDSGIFIMNFVYALYEKKLGSCILNCEFSKSQERAMRRIVAIKDHEIYAAIIAVSDIPSSESFLVANSSKKSTENMIQKL